LFVISFVDAAVICSQSLFVWCPTGRRTHDALVLNEQRAPFCKRIRALLRLIVSAHKTQKGMSLPLCTASPEDRAREQHGQPELHCECHRAEWAVS
jgi:hypothetical protein